MDELALVTIEQSQFPKNAEALKAILISNGLDGSYEIHEEELDLKNEDGVFEFHLFEEDSVIEIFGDFEDVAATLIELQEIFETSFTSASFSSAYDDF